MNEGAKKYIRDHRRGHTREDIDNKLRELGYTDDEIEVGWREVHSEEAEAYIRANRGVYTREALDNTLRASGYTDEEIQAAWQQALVEDKRREEANRARQMQVGGLQQGPSVSLGCVVAVLVVVGIVLLLLTNLGLGISGGGLSGAIAPAIVGLQWFVNIGSLVVLALWAVGVWLLKQRGWSNGQIASLIAAVALLWYLIVVGTCLYGSQYSG